MKKHTVPTSRAKRHAELKKQSLERPGVKELIDVYNHWKKSHKAIQAHQAIKNSGYKVACSDSSDPQSFFQERQ